jgi:hypothetical protein
VRFVHHAGSGRHRRSAPQQPAEHAPEQQRQTYFTFRTIVGTSSSTVSRLSLLHHRTRLGHSHGSSQQLVQVVRSRHQSRNQGLVVQPATQSGSHVTSNSVFGRFFVPGSHTQTGASPHVAPQCMQAGLPSSGLFFLSLSCGLSFAFASVFLIGYPRLFPCRPPRGRHGLCPRRE